MNFEELFTFVTGNSPYPYQSRLALGECMPDVIHVPTGVGKTAGVTLAWIWRRRFSAERFRITTPRRLVYCLPQRVLVEQTFREIEQWMRNLEKIEEELNFRQGSHGSHTGQPPVSAHMLLGGNVDNEWEQFPEQDVILVGTQDQLLSRALNRAYGISRYKWPIHFSLLSNDVLWVIDEIQLADIGLKTTTQLQAFREQYGSYGPAKTLWMSATFHPQWLNTVDFRVNQRTLDVLSLTDDDLEDDHLHRVVTGRKQLVSSEISLTKENARKDSAQYATDIAKLIAEHHVSGSMTLVVVNRVQRAQRIFQVVQMQHPEQKVLLIHSRFRSLERKLQVEMLLACSGGDCIVIATQAIEAGVDISARTLITEIAPWSSLIQRFGRCNRQGQMEDAKVLVIDVEDQADLMLPYDSVPIEESRRNLAGLTDVGSNALPTVEENQVLGLVLRKKDLLDFFDTSLDLGGADVDISRFIRYDRDVDVLVYWRRMQDNQPDETMRDVGRDEMCPVALSQIRAYFKTKVQLEERRAWVWDGVDGKFILVAPEDVYPGQTLLLNCDLGGYVTDIGFVPESILPVNPVRIESEKQKYAAHDDDLESDFGRYVELHQHLADVLEETIQLVSALPIDLPAKAVKQAALWHDSGKSHRVFQGRLKRTEGCANMLLAKAPFTKDKDSIHDEERPGFRHELASALAYMEYVRVHQNRSLTENDCLTAYLIAAHHGKVRVSIRSLPTERTPPRADLLYARGVWQDDTLPEVKLGDGSVMPEISLNLRPIQLGVNEQWAMSWTTMALAVLDKFGPFKLAYLETLVRIADWRASAKEAIQ